MYNTYIGGVSPVPRTAIAETPFPREGPMVSVSNLSRTSKISMDRPHRHRRMTHHSEVLFRHRRCEQRSKSPRNTGRCACPPGQWAVGTNNYQNVIGPKLLWQQCNSHISMQLVWASPDVLEYQTQTYGNIFKFVGDHQVVKFISSSEGLLDVHIGCL